MKILIAVDTFHPKKDGVVRFLDEIVPRLGKNHQVTVLAPAFKGKVGELERGNIKIVRLPLSRIFHAAGYSSVAFSRGALKMIKKYVAEADVVVAQDVLLAGAAAIIYAKRMKKTLCTFVHQISWEQFPIVVSSPKLRKLLSFIVRMLTRWLYKKCDFLLVPSECTKKSLNENGVHKEMKMIMLGIDTGKFRPAEDRANAKKALHISPETLVIGYCGRVSREKNIETLYEAFTKLKDKYRAKLLIVGEGEDKFLRDDPDIIVTGFVDNVLKYLQAMDIFVMPSVTETTSLATMEAMAVGLPVLSTPVGRIADFVKKGYNGYFFPKNSVDALEHELKELLNSPELRKKLGVNARMTMQAHSWEKTAQDFERIITSG
jgi:glycosyltransferase involved in cell wall biosynthesis